jgi:hypothetical protein
MPVGSYEPVEGLIDSRERQAVPSTVKDSEKRKE